MINGVRPALTGFAAFLSYYEGLPALGHILIGFLCLSLLWLVASILWISPEKQSGYFSFVPSLLDITFLTAFIYFTGGGLSTAILVYGYIVAVSAMNTRAPQGLFSAVYIVIIFSAMNLALLFGVLAPVNLLGTIHTLSRAETLQTIALVAIINFGLYFLIHGLVLSLEAKNRKLQEQSDRIQQTNRVLASRNRQMSDELEVARKIQETLIPRNMPSGESFRLEARYIALQQVGGDYLDFFENKHGEPGILVADAAGHGVPAALVASMTKIAADRFKERMHHPREFLVSLNRAILDKTNHHFVAAAYLYYRPKKKRLEYSIAGNPAPFLLRPGQPARQLEGQGSVLGIVESPKIESYRAEVQPGDRIVLFTDGIDECRDPSGRQLDRNQLESLLTGISTLPTTEETADRIVRELQSFTAERGFEDDVTLVVLTVLS